MKRFFPLGTLVVLVVTACGAGAKPAPRAIHELAARTRPSVRAIVTERRRVAGLEAKRSLREFVPPPGARAIRRPRNYGGVLRFPGEGPAAKFAGVHRYWSVRKPFDAVATFVPTHRPRGFESTEETQGEGLPPYRLWTFFWPTGRDRVPSRFLDVTAVGLPGRTLLRVDAKAVWVYPRSPREKAPSAVREIDVRAHGVSRKVTDPAKVARIVRWFDSLPITPPGVSLFCGLPLARHVTFVFRSAGGVRLASAVAPAGGASICDPIDFSVRGRKQVPLVDRLPAHGFVDRVQRLLGVRLTSSLVR